MIGSDYQEATQDANDVSISTAWSIHQDYQSYMWEMVEINPEIIRFIKDRLIAKQREDDELQQKIFKNMQYTLIPPIPSLYFLPYHVLIFDPDVKLVEMRNQIYTLNQDYSANLYLFQPIEYLLIKFHNQYELVNYNIRTINLSKKLHRKPQFLDQKHPIDKLYQYYSQYYKDIYLQQTTIMILYWAHQKDLIDDEITQHSLKLIILCIFINLGYGLSNIIHQQLNDKQIRKQHRKMYNYAKINKEGQTQIHEELLNNYVNYTIEEKQGFYMHSIKKIVQIKNIIPLSFPILPLNPEKDEQEKQRIENNLRSILIHEKQKVSICNNIFRIFKFLHDKLNKNNKLIIDFDQILAYHEEQSQKLRLQIIHPVLKKTICQLQDYSIHNFKGEINKIYTKFKKYREPLQIISEMCRKKFMKRISG